MWLFVSVAQYAHIRCVHLTLQNPCFASEVNEPSLSRVIILVLPHKSASLQNHASESMLCPIDSSISHRPPPFDHHTPKPFHHNHQLHMFQKTLCSHHGHAVYIITRLARQSPAWRAQLACACAAYRAVSAIDVIVSDEGCWPRAASC